LLQQIYGDAAVGELNTHASVHDIDHPDVEPQAPVLVTDADASQVSAVIDAAGGTSLVIQGPPGTGKSQTITNIIATRCGRENPFYSSRRKWRHLAW
jgi:hypothetical protein